MEAIPGIAAGRNDTRQMEGAFWWPPVVQYGNLSQAASGHRPTFRLKMPDRLPVKISRGMRRALRLATDRLASMPATSPSLSKTWSRIQPSRSFKRHL